MAGAKKRAMPDNTANQSSKRRKVRFLTTLSTRDFRICYSEDFRQCQYFLHLVSLTQPQGGGKWQKQQSNKAIIESGDWGVFVTCDMGREGKCIAEALDLFSQVSIMPRLALHYMTLPNLIHGIYQSVESAASNTRDEDSGSDEDEGDIEAQIRKEIEGLKPGSAKQRQFQAIRMEMPCGSSLHHLSPIIA